MKPLQPTWGIAAGMQHALLIAGEHEHAAQLGLADLSYLPRMGVKGPRAASWLAGQGILPPARPNSWLPLADGFIARLGLSEFLLEAESVSALASALEAPPAGAYPVLREDAEIALLGPQVNELLLQTCNVNFRAIDLAARPVVLTSMAGVSVTVLPGQHERTPFYRVWCDYTFGDYLFRTLLQIATELGGGPIGAALCPLPTHPS
jgi:sarcosine oxidase subunit gamma